MRLNTLNNLYVDQLKDLYSAERQLVQALPKMAEAANNAELKAAFAAHLQETQGHVKRIEQIFSSLDDTPGGENCKGMKGLIEEGDEIIKRRGKAEIKDAALIAAAQRVEHYEIAGYGVARTFAQQLGYTEAADLLQQTLDEEGEADKKLTSIAEGHMLKAGINEGAMQTA